MTKWAKKIDTYPNAQWNKEAKKRNGRNLKSCTKHLPEGIHLKLRLSGEKKEKTSSKNQGLVKVFLKEHSKFIFSESSPGRWQ